MAHSVTLPGRTLAIVCIYNNLDPDQSGYIYEIEPSHNLYEKYPDLCVIPMIHSVDVHKTENVPLCYVWQVLYVYGSYKLSRGKVSHRCTMIHNAHLRVPFLWVLASIKIKKKVIRLYN